MSEEAYRVADALAAAIAARDVEALRRVYADDIEVWHSPTNLIQTKEENCGLLDALFKITSRLSYDEVRRHPIEGGLVEQHVLTGAFTDGQPLPGLQVSTYIYVRGNQISRIEEYFDSNTFAPVWERLAAAAPEG